mmetsp:Transcript_96544/g.211129  ORF Transcript_96544/g.211129 Transcript_96544/m.211129 type:complete len:552 (+) Transcript_96544:333-1988(+)
MTKKDLTRVVPTEPSTSDAEVGEAGPAEQAKGEGWAAPAADAVSTIDQAEDGENIETKSTKSKKSVRIQKPAWDQRSDPVSAKRFRRMATRYWFDYYLGASLLALAVIDNSAYYAVYFSVNGVEARLYNVVEMQLVLIPWIWPAVLTFACLGSACFAAMIILVECNELPLYSQLMNLRLYLSCVPCACLSMVVFYYTEQTKWAPFAAVCCTCFFIFVWCLYTHVRWWKQFGTASKVLIDVSGFLALVWGLFLGILFCADALDIITKSDSMQCPYADNQQMPVYLPLVSQWTCAPWKESSQTYFSRSPLDDDVKELVCSDTFLNAFGSSIDAHMFSCPSGCLLAYDNTGLTGCGVYSTDSYVCIAAIHAGIIPEEGGSGVVYGRMGLKTFEGCSKSAMTSGSRDTTDADMVYMTLPSSSTVDAGVGLARRLSSVPPTLTDSLGARFPQAFHFNNLQSTKEYIWLKDWDVTEPDSDGVNSEKPWTRIESTISGRVLGFEFSDEPLRLGQRSDFDTSSPGTITCSLTDFGVRCPNVPDLLVNLDFCQPEEKQCM